MLQSAVYLARATKGGGETRQRQLHAPARRLARTTISLGPEEGIMFGLRSIRWESSSHNGADLCRQHLKLVRNGTTISLGPEEGVMFGLRSIRWGSSS